MNSRSGPPSTGRPTNGEASNASDPPGRFVSVGVKLASAMVALVFVVTAVVYVALSRDQRENVLRTKEALALAVATLFADSCAAATVFDDEAALKESVNALGHNDDVEYAAIQSSSAAAPVGPVLAALVRGNEVHVADVGAAARVFREPARLIVTAPVHDRENHIIAQVVIAFSLRAENEGIESVQRRTLLVSGAIAIGLTALLLLVVRVIIVKPLERLVSAANALEQGRVGEIAVHSRDEIGQLASAFRSMARAIRSREEHISKQNRDMRLVLDNVDQGFVTLDPAGRITGERSRVVDEWFDSPAEGTPFRDCLARHDETAAEWFELAWEGLRDGVLPIAVAVDQLPRTFQIGERSFAITYRPIGDGDLLGPVCVVIGDVTLRLERERAEQAQREMMSVFQHIVEDRTAFEQFLSEGKGLVERIVADGSALDEVALRRDIHTLKGNCAFFGIESIANLCDSLENRLADEFGELSSEERSTLSALWTKFVELHARFGGGRRIELDPEEFQAFFERLEKTVHDPELAASFLAFRDEPARNRLALASDQVQTLAAKLGKKVAVTCRPTALRLPKEPWAPFWSNFAHVLRNAVDHGVEPPDERLRVGKSEYAAVTLDIAVEGDHVVVSVEDDGRGIEWSKLADRAAALGLPHGSQTDLEEALFTDGVSSREQVTATSGRGAGMGAVREAVRKLSGRIEIATEVGQGTTFRFVLPATMLRNWPRQSAVS
ncbi:MAG TPA: ATP-binding protein [Labilithrix sp.]|nr:ATP-binding protein [Labilithrix sp.]